MSVNDLLDALPLVCAVLFILASLRWAWVEARDLWRTRAREERERIVALLNARIGSYMRSDALGSVQYADSLGRALRAIEAEEATNG